MITSRQITAEVCSFLKSNEVRSYMRVCRNVRDNIIASEVVYRQIACPEMLAERGLFVPLLWQIENIGIPVKYVPAVTKRASQKNRTDVVQMMASKFPVAAWEWMIGAARDGDQTIMTTITMVGLNTIGKVRWEALAASIERGHIGLAQFIRGTITKDDRQNLAAALQSGLALARQNQQKAAVKWATTELAIYKV